MDELEEMISEDITLDSRVHARIIGARGKGIRKIMDEFKVRMVKREGIGSCCTNLCIMTETKRCGGGNPLPPTQKKTYQKGKRYTCQTAQSQLCSHTEMNDIVISGIGHSKYCTLCILTNFNFSFTLFRLISGFPRVELQTQTS